MKLSELKCEVCRIGAPVVTAEEIAELHPEMPGWSIVEVDGIPMNSATGERESGSAEPRPQEMNRSKIWKASVLASRSAWRDDIQERVRACPNSLSPHASSP